MNKIILKSSALVLFVVVFISSVAVHAGGNLSFVGGSDSSSVVIKRWDANMMPIEWSLSSDGLPWSELTLAEIEGEFTVAFDAWQSVAESGVQFIYEGESNRHFSSDDGTNLITFTDPDVEFPPGVAGVAVTYSFASETVIDDSNNDLDGDGVADLPNGTYPAGTIYDGNIVMNSSMAFSLDGANGSVDLRSVALHEIGHFIGMSHSSIDSAVMWPFLNPVVSESRSLALDDLMYVSHTYPQEPSYSQEIGIISGIITNGFTGFPILGAHIYAVDISTGEKVIGAYSDQSGHYEIPVPTGAYYVGIEPLDGDPEALNPERINDVIAATFDTAFPEELYDGNESNVEVDPLAALPVLVSAGATTDHIDLQTNIANAAGVTRVLYPGINYFAYPVSAPTTLTAFDLLRNLGDENEISSIERLDSSTQLYERASYVDGVPEGIDFAIRQGEGYLVHALAQKAVTFRGVPECIELSLVSGLNFVSVSCPPSGFSAYDLLALLGSDHEVASIRRYDPDTSTFQTVEYVSGQPAGENFFIVNGEGYLIDLYVDLGLVGAPGESAIFPPAITGVSPGRGLPNDLVLIQGEGFSGDILNNTVIFNGSAAHVVYSSPTLIAATVPFGATSGPLLVTSSGRDSNSVDFIVEPFQVTEGATGASEVLSGQVVTGELTVNAEQDRYEFMALEGALVTIEASRISGTADLMLALEGPSGVLLVSDDDGGPGNTPAIRNFTLPETGRYSVVVTAVSGYGAYELSLSVVNIAAEPKISVLSGGAQTALVGSDLAHPFSIYVTGSSGQPLVGVPVTFTANNVDVVANNQGFSLQNAGTVVVSTNRNGFASIHATAPSTAGVFDIIVTVPGMDPVTMQVSTIETPIHQVILSNQVEDCGGTGCAVGQPVSSPYSVTYLDAAGHPVPNVFTEWHVVAGGGSLSDLSPSGSGDRHLTDESGVARITHTLGQRLFSEVNGVRTKILQPQIVAASIAGQSTPVLFSAQSRAGTPVSIESRYGSYVRTTYGFVYLNAITLLVSDEYGNPVEGAQINVEDVRLRNMEIIPGRYKGIFFPDFRTNEEGIWVAAISLPDDIVPTLDELDRRRNGQNVHLQWPYRFILSEANAGGVQFEVDVDLGPRMGSPNEGESALVGQDLENHFLNYVHRFYRVDQDDDGLINDEDFTDLRQRRSVAPLARYAFVRDDGFVPEDHGVQGTTLLGLRDAVISLGELHGRTPPEYAYVTMGDVGGSINIVGQLVAPFEYSWAGVDREVDLLERYGPHGVGIVAHSVELNAVIDADQLSGVDWSSLRVLFNGGTAIFDGSNPEPPRLNEYPHFIRLFIDGAEQSVWPSLDILEAGGFSQFTISYQPLGSEIIDGTNTLAIEAEVEDFDGTVTQTSTQESFSFNGGSSNLQWQVNQSFDAKASFTIGRTVSLAQSQGRAPSAEGISIGLFKTFDVPLVDASTVEVQVLDRFKTPIETLIGSTLLPAGSYNFVLTREDLASEIIPSSGRPDFYLSVQTTSSVTGLSRTKLYSGELTDSVTGKILGQVIQHDTLIQDGSLTLRREDLSLNGGGPQLNFIRSYSNSRGPENSDTDLGPGWSHNHDIYVKVLAVSDNGPSFGERLPGWVAGTRQGTQPQLMTADALNALIQAGGPKIPSMVSVSNGGTFERELSGEWVGQRGNHGRFSGDLASGYVYTSKDGTVYVFNSAPDNQQRYKVARITDRNGNTLTYDYDAHRLTRVTDQAGRALSFTYQRQDDGSLRLTQLVADMGVSGSSQDITLDFNYFRRESSNSDEVASHFDEVGMLQSFTREGFVEQYDYDAVPSDNEPNMVSVTDANGHETQYQYLPVLSVPSNFRLMAPGTPLTDIVHRVCYPFSNDDCSSEYAQIDYPLDEGNVRVVTDIRGNPTTYHLNPWGNPSRIEEPEGKITEFDWSIDLGLPDNVIREKRDLSINATWTYEYDALGNVILETDPYNNTIVQTWDQDYSILTSRTDKNGHSFSQDLDSNGNVLREIRDAYVEGETTPSDVTVAHAYDTVNGIHGLKVSTTDALTNTILFDYDHFGNLSSVTEPGDSVTRYENNARGLRTKAIDANNNETSYVYDDLDRVVLLTDAELNTVETRYDTKGNKTLEISVDRYGIKAVEHVRTQSLEYVYDERDRVVEITRMGNLDSAYPLGGRKTFLYDGNSNLISESDWKGIETTHEYDGLNRRTRTLNRLDDDMSYSYEWVANNGLRKTTADYEAHETVEHFDLLGRLVRVQHPTVNHSDDTLNSYERIIGYDNYENVTSILDEEGRLTRYVYDPRYLKIEQINALNDSYFWEYDAHGNLRKTIDEESNETSYVYDEQNRLTEKLQPESHRWSYRYYPNDKLLSETDPWGFEYEYTYNKINLRTSITDPDGETIESYSKDGELVYRRDAERREQTYLYGPESRLQVSTDGRGRTTTYQYDNNDNITRTDVTWLAAATGPQTVYKRYEYDALDRVTHEHDADRSSVTRVTRYEYDRQGNKTSVINPEQRVVDYLYDELYRVKTIVSQATSDGLETNTLQKYDGVGNLVWEQDRRGNATSYEYDDLHRLETITDALNQTVVNGYDEVGNIVAITDKRGHTIETVYDDLYRVTEKFVNDNDETRFRLLLNEYDINNAAPGNLRRNATTDANNNRVVSDLDFRGNATHVELPAGVGFIAATIEHEYDDAGLLTSTTDAAGFATTYSYFDDGTVSSITNADAEETQYQYDVFGNRAITTKPRLNVQRSTYDSRNRLDSVVDHHGNTTRFEYDVNNNLRHQYSPAARASGETHVEYTYDTLNRKRSHIQHKAGGNLVSSYVYDAEGNLTQINDASGQVFTQSYDELNRLDVETFPASDDIISIVHTYDENNNMDVVTETKPAGIEVSDYDYDLLDRLIGHNQRGHIVSYTYDNNGNRTNVTAPGGSTTYTYDSRNRLATATAGGAPTPTSYTYLQNGWTDVVTHANGTSVDYDYYPDGQTQTITNRSGASVVSSFAYLYDVNNNRTQQIETQTGFSAAQVLTTDYVYDTLDRLESYTETSGDATHSATHTFTYFPSYDRQTEIVNINGTETKNRSFEYDETYWLDIITETAGSGGTVTYAYDNNGNTLSKADGTGVGPASTLFSYNRRNQLKTVDTGAQGSEVNQGSYDYNYDGMRIRHLGSDRGDIEYIYDQKSILDEVENNTTSQVAHYRYGDRLLSLDDGAEEQFYHYASLGTTTNLSDAGGQIHVSYRTDPFGKITQQEGTSDNRRVFTGHEHDTETGLIYMKARFYDPDVGRFLNQDTYLGENGTPPSLHRYLYAYGNPALYIDEDGRAAHLWSAQQIDDYGEQLYREGNKAGAAGVAIAGAFYKVGTGFFSLGLFDEGNQAITDNDTATGAANQFGTSVANTAKDVAKEYAEEGAASAVLAVGGKVACGRWKQSCKTVSDTAKKVGDKLNTDIGKAKKKSGPSITDEKPNLNDGNGQKTSDSGNSAGASEPQRHTRETTLSKKKTTEIKQKVDDRAASKEEWEKLQSDKRFNNRRKRGVDKFWSEEKKRLKNGEEGTRDWSDPQREQILSSDRKKPTFDGEPIEGHHKYNAQDYPQIADDPSNIYPATKIEHHQRWHGGNFQNETSGKPLNPLFEEEF